ncbi:PQQ-dependent sugar dehydrogenase [Spirosoma pollinicola]|nr:PQQ-dependent sugar dehydrogenase [Spirosoma pollinicola]
MGLLIAHPTRAQTFPPNFAGIQLATGLDPVGMDIAPNGRIFLTEKSGNIRIVSNGTLLPTPFLTIPNVDNYNERGVQGIVLDPDFSTNNFVYVYYTYKAPGGSVSNNRVSRFTANGDIALSGSERVLLDIDPLSSAGNHNGGSLAFKDGKLLISVGENANGDNAQSFTTLKGKILRLNPDGSIPTDNPFYNSTVGNNRAIWALGLRNPFRIVVQPGTGTVFVNDVGQSAYEEINQVVAGKNYGWPGIEGNRTNQTPPTNYQDPVYAYNHDSGCSITAGEFYNPSTAQFPSSYMGKYFFADYCGGWIKTMDPATKSITSFSTGLNRPLVIKVGLDGSLYFIARGGIGGGSDADNTSSNGGVLWKVTYTGNGMPVVAVQPVNKTVSVGESVTFSVSASGTPTPTYQWQRNGVAISGATAASYVLPSVTLNDNGAVFKVVVSNSAGSVTSGEATLTVLTNQKPTATIITPTAGKTYSGGDVIDFSGRGVDPEDGNLPASALSWRVDLYHYDIPTHFHPVLESTSGISSGSFTIPVSGETSPHVLYRIYLTVTDSKGATTTSTVDVNPIQSVITLVSQPAGLTVKFDGTVVTTPFTFTGVSGISRSLDVVDQTKNGSNYTFYSWSDGGAAAHTLNTPSTAATITATYIRSADVVSGVTNGVSYTYVEGEYASLPAFSTLTPVKTGTTTDFTLAPRNREDNFAFLFKGYVDLPTDGKYTFYTQSDDGSRLSIGGAVVVDNDGLHGFLEKSGSIYLKAGKHAIDVTFFERDGDQILNVLYEGPGIGKKTIPSSVLFYAPVGTPGSGGLADGIYELEPQHAIGKRLLVSGAGTADGTEVQIGTANGSVSQGWKLTDVGGGFYDLSPQYILSKRLDVNNAGRENGTKVQIWTSNTTQAQRWKVIDKGNNIYEFAPECALDKRLDVSGVSTSDGTKLITWTSTGGANQRWKLISRSSARLAEERIPGDKPVGTGLANYPNPFDQTTTVTFPISSSARQSLIQIYTLQGELVRSIDVSTNQEGRYELSRDRLGDGIYIYRLLGDGILKASQRLIISN